MRFSEDKLIQHYGFLSNSPVLIDVGAHQGSISKLFATMNWRIIAFEPENKNRSKFIQNLAPYSNVVCIPKAVSDTAGALVPFYVSNEHFGIHTLKPFHETHQLAYEVETVRLDDILVELSISNVTFLKIDIEGADFLALKSFDFERYQPELVMTEFMDSRSQPNFGYTHHDIVSYMQDRGYVAFISEWETIKEYGREGQVTEPHKWIQCMLYPLDHEPAWGNLIFVPAADQEKFAQTLKTHLKTLPWIQRIDWLKKQAQKIPGSQSLYRRLMGKG